MALDDGGFSTNEVSVVMKVASLSASFPLSKPPPPPRAREEAGPTPPMLMRATASRACSCRRWRRKLSGRGASGKSTQKAFMFRPYRKAAKLSEKRASDSCISCRCMKLASRSAMLSLSSANCGSSASSGVAPCALVDEV